MNPAWLTDIEWGVDTKRSKNLINPTTFRTKKYLAVFVETLVECA